MTQMRKSVTGSVYAAMLVEASEIHICMHSKWKSDLKNKFVIDAWFFLKQIAISKTHNNSLKIDFL